MEVHHTFCHSKDEGASDFSPRCYPESPLDWLCVQLEELKATVTLPDSDWLLIEKYLLMPLFDVNSIHDLDISAADKNRLYFLMSQKSQPIAELLTQVGYELFFTEVDAFGSASACDRSRYRPHLIADDNKVAKADSSCMEYLTELFCPVEGVKLPAYNLVVLVATFGETDWEIPIAIRLWLPKTHPDYQSKPRLLKAMIDDICAEAEKRGLSLFGVQFSCDAAYQRSHALMGAVNLAGLRLVTKVSSNMTFWVGGQRKKAATIRDEVTLAQMKQSGRLGCYYRYRRLVAQHPQIGPVILIVSSLYDEKHDKYRRIVLMSNDLQIQAPAAILMYKRRWRIEVWFKSAKQELCLGRFQFRKLGSIISHFQLRGIAYLVVNVVRRCGFVHRSQWTFLESRSVGKRCADRQAMAGNRINTTFSTSLTLLSPSHAFAGLLFQASVLNFSSNNFKGVQS